MTRIPDFRARGLRTAVAVLMVAVFAILGLVVWSMRPESVHSSHPSGSAVTAADGSRIVAVHKVSQRMVDLTIDSVAVGREVPVRLLLPARYDADPQSRWPVLYLLHGCCDSYVSWTRSTDVEALSAGSDILVVMPDGGRVGFYSNWVRGPQWETFHLVELRRLLEQAFRAGTRWAVAGVSMGGLGAIDYATHHPGLFRAAASYSGLLNTLGDGGHNAQELLSLIASEGEHPAALWGDPQTDAAQWTAHNPYDVAQRLRGTALFVSGGNGEPGPLDPAGTQSDRIEQFVHRQTADFVRRIGDLRIPATIDLYGPGTHTWPYWEQELHRSWPLLTSALGIPTSAAITATPTDCLDLNSPRQSSSHSALVYCGA